MFFDKNFATQNQMERLNKLFYFTGNLYVCNYTLENGYETSYVISIDAPSSILDKCKILYQTSDLTEILNHLPETVGAYVNGEFEHYYVNINHYTNMISYCNTEGTKVLHVFTSNNLLNAAVDAIEWIQSKRQENDGIFIKIEE